MNERGQSILSHHFRVDVALLRAEVAGLKATVLNLTRPVSPPAPTLEIIGMHQPERVSLSRSLRDGPEFHRVALSYRNDLSASCLLAGLDPALFLAFFEDLAQHKQGWEGEKKVASLEEQLTISCTYEGNMFRPEVCMVVNCALDLPSFDPYWMVVLRLEVDPESLENLAVQARELFKSV